MRVARAACAKSQGTTRRTELDQLTEAGPADSIGNVGIVPDNVWALSTELQGSLLQVGRSCGLEDVSSDESGTGESNLVDVHVVGNGSTCNWTETRNNVDDTRWNTSLLDELGELQSREWSLLGGLEHNDVTSSQGWSNLPGEHEEWEVPWDDLTTDTDWLVTSVGELGVVHLNGLTVVLVGPSCVVSEVGCCFGNVECRRDAEGLSVVEGFNGSKLVLVSLNGISESLQDSASLGSGDLQREK